MAKGDVVTAELSLTARNKTNTSVAQAKPTKTSTLGGPSNAVAQGKMQNPMMNPNKLKIGKKKKRGR